MSAATAGPSSPLGLLTGPILPLLLRFALPNMVAMVAVALAAMAIWACRAGRYGLGLSIRYASKHAVGWSDGGRRILRSESGVRRR